MLTESPRRVMFQGGKYQRAGKLKWSAGLGGAGLAAPFLGRLFVMFTRLKKLKNPFALHFLFQALEGLFKRLVLTDIDF
ncbi:MAG: hypothetical protein BWY44_00289 [Candidatus Omnitrophica bacterium ADurb.Bin292]|nr:MAG: hypothetical protein BWY44_00289 [Candidatus Omnitrophica bacterium ADurb.Bin292]